MSLFTRCVHQDADPVGPNKKLLEKAVFMPMWTGVTLSRLVIYKACGTKKATLIMM